MGRRIRTAVWAVLLLAVLAGLGTPAQGADYWSWDETLMDDWTFRERKLSAVDDSFQGNRSMFAWDMYFLNSGAFPALSNVLTAYKIDRVYQDIPAPYFQVQELPDMLERMDALGIQVIALAGDRRWPEKGLDEYKDWIDALDGYNQGHPSRKISSVALDVESYTLSSFKKDPAAGFAAYARCMEEAYQYARERGLRVVQIIPASLDAIDRDQFEWFVGHCCDELSVMNYYKDTELAAIWNEVLTCRRLGVPVETIFETMPVNDYYSVTKEKTYFYSGARSLAGAVEEMRDVYGPSLGIAYHHFETMYHVYTNLYLAEVYPYAKSRAGGDENGQIEVGERIRLRSKKGTVVPAWLSAPNLETDASEFCYLAVGVQLNTDYSVLLDGEDYRVTTARPLRFKKKNGKVTYSESFHAEYRHSSTLLSVSGHEKTPQIFLNLRRSPTLARFGFCVPHPISITTETVMQSSILQQHNRLHMPRPRKHIHRRRPEGPVAPLREQLYISSQGSRVAGHVHNPLRPHSRRRGDHLRRQPLPGRVHRNYVRPQALGGQHRRRVRRVAAEELHIVHTVSGRVFLRVPDGGGDDFRADGPLGPARQAQGDGSRAAVKVQRRLLARQGGELQGFSIEDLRLVPVHLVERGNRQLELQAAQRVHQKILPPEGPILVPQDDVALFRVHVQHHAQGFRRGGQHQGGQLRLTGDLPSVDDDAAEALALPVGPHVDMANQSPACGLIVSGNFIAPHPAPHGMGRPVADLRLEKTAVHRHHPMGPGLEKADLSLGPHRVLALVAVVVRIFGPQDLLHPDGGAPDAGQGVLDPLPLGPQLLGVGEVAEVTAAAPAVIGAVRDGPLRGRRVNFHDVS